MSALADIAALRARTLRALVPPPRLKLSDWIERVGLPPTCRRFPGPVRLWPYQRATQGPIELVQLKHPQ